MHSGALSSKNVRIYTFRPEQQGLLPAVITTYYQLGLIVHIYNPALTRPRKEGSACLRQAWLWHKMQKKKRTQSLKSSLYGGSILLLSSLGPRQEMPQVLGQPDPGQLQTETLSQRSTDSILCCLKYSYINQLIPRVPGK